MKLYETSRAQAGFELRIKRGSRSTDYVMPLECCVQLNVVLELRRRCDQLCLLINPLNSILDVFHFRSIQFDARLLIICYLPYLPSSIFSFSTPFSHLPAIIAFYCTVQKTPCYQNNIDNTCDQIQSDIVCALITRVQLHVCAFHFPIYFSHFCFSF